MAETLHHVIHNVWPRASVQSPQEIKDRESSSKEFEERMKNQTIKTVFGDVLANDCDLSMPYKQHKEWVDVNCWHSNESESMAMWKIYGGSTNSLCIVTNAERLIKSVKHSAEKKLILSEIKYIDHAKDDFKVDHPLSPLLHKSKFYSFENEVRLIAINPNINVFDKRIESDNGTLVSVELDILISEIRVAHDAPNWFLDLVRSIVKGKYGLNIDVNSSKMSQSPIYEI